MDGAAEIELDRNFASMTRTDSYHVFLTPYGDSQGLYVERRTQRSFTVREQRGGTSGLSFSYRVVAKRRDIDVPRFKKMETPQAVSGGPEELDETQPGVEPEAPPRLENVLEATPRMEVASQPRLKVAIRSPNADRRMGRQ